MQARQAMHASNASKQCKQAMQASNGSKAMQAIQASNASKQCKQCNASNASKQCKQAMQAKQSSQASKQSTGRQRIGTQGGDGAATGGDGRRRPRNPADRGNYVTGPVRTPQCKHCLGNYIYIWKKWFRRTPAGAIRACIMYVGAHPKLRSFSCGNGLL